jgi:hypothetical protein
MFKKWKKPFKFSNLQQPFFSLAKSGVVFFPQKSKENKSRPNFYLFLKLVFRSA